MTPEEMRREKARKMRYKKPIAKSLNLEQIRSDLYDIQSDATELSWTEDDEALVAALDGDTDEAWEFRMAFSDLVADAERMESDLDESWVPECFDTFFPAVGTRGGYLGFDEYEGDYYGLEPWEDDYAERCARDKLMQMRKADIFDAAGACLRIAQQYMALMYRYDCLRASIDILKNQNEGLHDEEQEAYDNLPESFQESERGEAMEAAADNLDSAMSSMEEVLDSLNAAIG